MKTKEEILKRLEEHKNYAIETLDLNEDDVIGIFLYGSQNYCLANENSDIDTKMIVVPSFEDVCFQKKRLSKEVHIDNEHCEVKDIRDMAEMFKKQNTNFIETLYTDFYILNPKYEQLFKTYFIQNRDLISHYDRYKTVLSIGSQAIHTLKQNPTDNKKLANGYRLFYFLRDYLAGRAYKDAICPAHGDHTFLWDLKFNNPFSEEEKKQQSEALVKEFLKFLETPEIMFSPDRDAADDALYNGVYEIMSLALGRNNQMSKKEFLNNLTSTETKAYNAIVKEIHEKGNISLSKMVNKYSISRPVFNNLLSKLKEYNVAEVTAQGMKGTYIKITQPELKADAMEV